MRLAHDGESRDAGGPRLDPAALVRQAATAVHAAAQGRNLGTTITCVVVHDGELTLAHVGDTRAYLLRDGVLTQLTADHSLVAAMVASGVITPEEARGPPGQQQGAPLAREPARAAGQATSTAWRRRTASPASACEPGDWLLLCSDGVWGTVDGPRASRSS